MNALQYAKDLVSFESTSSLSNVAISDHVETTLKRLGFATERVDYDDANGGRKASVVGKKGSGTGGMAYFGHTDVVPADAWFTDEHGPFSPTVKDDRLYGRGSCDMKGSVACMLAAAAEFSAAQLTKPSRMTGTFCMRAAMIAPAIAAISRPPTRRRISIGSFAVPCNAAAAATAARRAVWQEISAAAPARRRAVPVKALIPWPSSLARVLRNDR